MSATPDKPTTDAQAEAEARELNWMIAYKTFFLCGVALLAGAFLSAHAREQGGEILGYPMMIGAVAIAAFRLHRALDNKLRTMLQVPKIRGEVPFAILMIAAIASFVAGLMMLNAGMPRPFGTFTAYAALIGGVLLGFRVLALAIDRAQEPPS